jgi:hypothetical protein
MDPSTLGSTRRSATVAIEASEATSEALSTSIDRKPPVPTTSLDVELSEPIVKRSPTGPAY